MRKSYVEAVKEHRAYDYIASNYWEMSKEELKDCLLEALYQLDENADNKMVKEIESCYEIYDDEQ